MIGLFNLISWNRISKSSFRCVNWPLNNHVDRCFDRSILMVLSMLWSTSTYSIDRVHNGRLLFISMKASLHEVTISSFVGGFWKAYLLFENDTRRRMDLIELTVRGCRHMLCNFKYVQTQILIEHKTVKKIRTAIQMPSFHVTPRFAVNVQRKWEIANKTL